MLDETGLFISICDFHDTRHLLSVGNLSEMDVGNVAGSMTTVCFKNLWPLGLFSRNFLEPCMISVLREEVEDTKLLFICICDVRLIRISSYRFEKNTARTESLAESSISIIYSRHA